MIRAYMLSLFQVKVQLAVTETFSCDSLCTRKSWNLRVTSTVWLVKAEIGVVQNKQDRK